MVARANSINYTSHGFETVSIFKTRPQLAWSDRLVHTFMDLLYPNKNKEGQITSMGKSSMDTFLSLCFEGYVEAKATCPVHVKLSTEQKTEINKVAKTFVDDFRSSIVLSKDGGLNVDVGKDKPFNLTIDAAIKLFEKLSKGVKVDEGLAAANRRWCLVQLANPVRVELGLEPITEWRRELRGYTKTSDLKKDIIRLNEDEETGKQKTSVLEKINSAFALAKMGCIEAEFGPVFIKRGVIQLMSTVTKLVIYTSFIDKSYAKQLKEDICGGIVVSISQAHLKALRALKMACEHSDWSTKHNPATFLGTGKRADAVRVKANILANKERTVGAIKAYFEKVKDPDFKPNGRVQGLPREKVVNIAAGLDDGSVGQNLLMAVANNDAEGVVKHLEEVEKLVPALYWRKKDESLSTEHYLVQDDIDLAMQGRTGYKQAAKDVKARQAG